MRWQLRSFLGAALLFVAPMVSALNVTISAEYLGGGTGRFDNTTPPGGLCSYLPILCRGRTTVTLPITFDKKTTKGAADPRDQFYISLPPRRQIEVYHDATGDSRQLTFDWTAISQRVEITNNLNYHPLYQMELNGGCRHAGSASQFRPAIVTYMMNITQPAAPSPCWAGGSNAPNGRVEMASVLDTSVAYAIDIAPPFRMPSGTWRGSVTYSIGPGGDFDFGNDVTALSGNSLTVNFILDVQHAFIFEFPPGSDRAVLEPPGGWQGWLAGGKAPQRLVRDLPFRVWSTGPFKVYKLCQHYADSRCAIRNHAADEVPVEVAMSLPAGIEHRGAPVQRLALPSGRLAALQFDAAMATLNRPGQLHLQVARDDMDSMLRYPGTTYTGQVTVIFDAEL